MPAVCIRKSVNCIRHCLVYSHQHIHISFPLLHSYRLSHSFRSRSGTYLSVGATAVKTENTHLLDMSLLLQY